MSISKEEVDKIATLARLKFTPEEKLKLQQELSGILDYVNQLTQITESSAASDLDSRALNLMREDIAAAELNPTEFLDQANGQQDGFVKVKSVF
ncbi:MAG TPA: Asp-tRNA(Asn)/Glu-tRNA(Gln) amidotransferase subunit GatC [Patescibacteria group bacterium]|nr:Asp-tRNA(Asn)/Glu-tRNA(Gln) amidotransferase subunit GatC [Patescibacteria group bacterium]